MDAVLRRILDPDIIMLNSFLKRSMEVLLQDPLRLAPEILAVFRSLKGYHRIYKISFISEIEKN